MIISKMFVFAGAESNTGLDPWEMEDAPVLLSFEFIHRFLENVVSVKVTCVCEFPKTLNAETTQTSKCESEYLSSWTEVVPRSSALVEHLLTRNM